MRVPDLETRPIELPSYDHFSVSRGSRNSVVIFDPHIDSGWTDAIYRMCSCTQSSQVLVERFDFMPEVRVDEEIYGYQDWGPVTKEQYSLAMEVGVIEGEFVDCLPRLPLP
jgi:hypothetical protein